MFPFASTASFGISGFVITTSDTSALRMALSIEISGRVDLQVREDPLEQTVNERRKKIFYLAVHMHLFPAHLYLF